MNVGTSIRSSDSLSAVASDIDKLAGAVKALVVMCVVVILVGDGERRPRDEPMGY